MAGDGIDTERRLSEALQRELAARSAGEVAESALRAVVAASPLAIVSLDSSGRVASWNASAERMFGWSAEEVIGKPSPTVPAEAVEESDAILREVLAGQTVTGLHRRRMRKDGSAIMVGMSTAPLFDEKGEVRGTVIIAEDVTAQERAEVERNFLLAREREARSRAEDVAGRLSQLQQVSAALSEALTPEEVADVILTQGMEALGATAASISRTVPGKAELEIIAAAGYGDEELRDFARVPLDSRVPLAYSARTGSAVWIESPDQWNIEFPDFASARGDIPPRSSASIPLLVKGRVLGTIGLSFSDVRSFSDDDKGFAISLAQQCAQALERARLYEAERTARDEAESSRRRFEFLAQASITLSSSLDYSTTLASVARLAVPHIADWCSVYIIEESGLPRLLEVAHIDPKKVALAHELDRRYPFDPDAPTGLAQVLRTSESELIPYIPDEMLVDLIPDPDLLRTMRELGLVSAMTVPLVARGRVLGAITFVSAESEHHYGEGDLALASDLAGRAAIAVDNARLLRESQTAALEREAILGQIADGIVIADSGGTTTFANSVAQSILGPRVLGIPAAAHAETFNAFRPTGEPYPSGDLPLVRACINNETIVNQDVVIQHPHGPSIIIECSATPVVDEAGTKLGGVVSFRDVTAQRTLERQKDDFLSAVAHDLKTPLTTIKGLSQILGRRAARANTPETTALLEGLNRIDVTTTRMSGLINELLDVSRIQMGRSLDLIRTSVDLVDLIRHIANEQQHTTELHAVRVTAPETEVRGEWDSVRLERAFTNLVSNAITYSPSGGAVQITVEVDRADEPVAVVHIEDEGLGIPDQDLPHIFDRFHRGSNVAGRIPGTGIGLAGAREIFQQHGGKVSARSLPAGGTCFEVMLPLDATAPEESNAQGTQ